MCAHVAKYFLTILIVPHYWINLNWKNKLRDCTVNLMFKICHALHFSLQNKCTHTHSSIQFQRQFALHFFSLHLFSFSSRIFFLKCFLSFAAIAIGQKSQNEFEQSFNIWLLFLLETIFFYSPSKPDAVTILKNVRACQLISWAPRGKWSWIWLSAYSNGNLNGDKHDGLDLAAMNHFF